MIPIKFDHKAVMNAVKNVVTQSEIMTRAACPRKWYYRYALLLDRAAAPNYNLIYGELMHRALANYYSSDSYLTSPKDRKILVPEITVPEETLLMLGVRDELELVRAKVQIAFNAYRWHYYDEDLAMKVIATEQSYETTWQGIELQGRIDLIACPKARDKEFIWDFKTAGRFDATMLDAWSFRFQFLFYCWLYWKCTGMKPAGTMANGLAKTQLRPKIINMRTKEKESKEAYLARVADSFQTHRDRFFYRQRMPMVSGMLERFEDEILGPHIDVFRHLTIPTNPIISRPFVMAMNTGHCHVYNTFCEYLPLCKDGAMMLPEYRKRDAKHPELESSSEEMGSL